jgi:hypothetical protein
MPETIKITEQVNKVVISSSGPQGPRGRTILNGTWAGANIIDLVTKEDIAFVYSWELAQVVGPVNGVYTVTINHNLGFSPGVTVKSNAGDVLETGIDYNSLNTLTLTMAQPFSGTAYLS